MRWSTNPKKVLTNLLAIMAVAPNIAVIGGFAHRHLIRGQLLYDMYSMITCDLWVPKYGPSAIGA